METWYQINPDYFREVLEKQALKRVLLPNQTSFFELLKLNLDYVLDLGCTGIWLMPIFRRGELNKKSRHGSPYAIKSYQVDSRYGSSQELSSLIDLAHQKQLKVICGYVPNHLSPDAPFVQENSAAVYQKHDQSFYYDQNWSDTVKLNHAHYLTKGYTSANLKWLLKNLKLDGFRLDMAHYVFHGANSKDLGLISQGKGDPNFWEQIFRSSSELRQKYWLAEVYDDRDKSYFGYADQIKLLREGFYVYDKKTHDLLAWKLKQKDQYMKFSEVFYQELKNQSEAAELSKSQIWQKKEWPFLRFVANHDDTPAQRIFGGSRETLLAYTLLSLLPGEFVLYAGEEFGLQVKPSITGINYFSEEGEALEANEITLLEKEGQVVFNQLIKELLWLRKNETLLEKGQLSVLLPKNKDQSPNHQVFCFMRYSLLRKGALLVVANLGSNTQWVKLDQFFPGLPDQKELFRLEDLIVQLSSFQNPKKYQLIEVFSGKSEEREVRSEFWVGLRPLETQVYKILVPEL